MSCGMFNGCMFCIKQDKLLSKSHYYYLYNRVTGDLRKVRGWEVQDLIRRKASISGVLPNNVITGVYVLFGEQQNVMGSIQDEVILALRKDFTAVWYRGKGVIAHNSAVVYSLDPIVLSIPILVQELKCSYSDFMRLLVVEV